MNAYGVALFLTFALTACDSSTKMPKAELPATDEVLSEYKTIHIGKNKLRLPAILLLSSTTNSSLKLSDGNQVPIGDVLSNKIDDQQVSVFSLSIHAYRQLQDYTLDTHAYVGSEFCEKLLARWERDQCKLGLYNGKEQFYPQHFSIIERSYLMNSDEQLFAISGGGPSGGDSARKLLDRQIEPSIICEQKQQPLCTAQTLIRDDLVAVWGTRREDMDADRKRIHWIMEQYLNR